MRRSKILVSIFILSVIGLHAVPVILDRGHSQILWPFLVWAMYKNSRPPGPITGWKTNVLAITENGATQPVTPELVGLSGSTLWRRYYNPWRTGDTTAPSSLIARLNRDRQEPFVELRLIREAYTVSDTGLIKADPLVFTYRLDPRRSR
jgi:hypothetical protein